MLPGHLPAWHHIGRDCAGPSGEIWGRNCWGAAGHIWQIIDKDVLFKWLVTGIGEALASAESPVWS